MPATLGRKISMLRKQFNLSQQKLADKLNISLTHLAQIEINTAKPSLNLLEKIAKTLKVTPAQFFPLMQDEVKDLYAQELLNLMRDEKIEDLEKFIRIARSFFPKQDWAYLSSTYVKKHIDKISKNKFKK